MLFVIFWGFDMVGKKTMQVSERKQKWGERTTAEERMEKRWVNLETGIRT
jgi:hypothetical protein